MKYLKTHESFIQEGLITTPTDSYLYKYDRKNIQIQAQSENDVILRNKIKDKIKSGDININNIKFKYINGSIYDFYIILPDKLLDFLYKNGIDEEDINKLEITLEKPGHRIHINYGIPPYLRGLGLGYSIYKNFIKYIGWGYSKGDAKINAKLIWKKLLIDPDFYIISSPNKILAIDKNIVGKQVILKGITMYGYINIDNKVYSDENVIEIISKFLRNHTIEDLKKIEIDPDLIKKYPIISKELKKYLNYNIKTIDDIKMSDYNIGDLLEFELENGKKYELIITKLPYKVEQGEGRIFLSDRTGDDKYYYHYDIDIDQDNKNITHKLSYIGDIYDHFKHIKINNVKIKSRTVQTIQK